MTRSLELPAECTALLELVLGLRLEVDRLRFTPCLPADWKSFLLHYRYRETFYHITVRRSGPGCDVANMTVDDLVQSDMAVILADDHKEHFVEVMLGLSNRKGQRCIEAALLQPSHKWA